MIHSCLATRSTTIGLVTLALLGCAPHARSDRPTGSVPSEDPAPPAGAVTGPWENGWARGAVFYEIFVRSFRDSNGDGAGDLPGVIEKLDYLNDGDPATASDLGVDAIWLMPIFPSPSYHGYDVVDYEGIHPDYGTVSDFERLCAEAHRRGIHVIIDLVTNHSSSRHPWFQESASPESPRRDWYVWRSPNPGWKRPWDTTADAWHTLDGTDYYYGIFSPTMPDLNLANPEVEAELLRIATLWLERGADGFRLDAARYAIETGAGAGQADTPATFAFWERFAARVREVKPGAVLVGENWTDAAIIARYYRAAAEDPERDGLTASFNFPLASSIVEGVRRGTAAGIAAALARMAEFYPAGALDAPFLTNHDMVRVAKELRYDVPRLRNVAWVLLTLPGAPFLYYGEELGLDNSDLGMDEAARAPMAWTADEPGYGFTAGTAWTMFPTRAATANVAVETADPASLLSHYRRLIRLRHGWPALGAGTLELLSPTSGRAPLLAYYRTTADQRLLIVHNVTDSPAGLGSLGLSAGGHTLEPVLVDAGVSEASEQNGHWQIALPPRTSGVWRVR